MKKSTRLMGALLALIFVFALLPVSAFAAEPAAVPEFEAASKTSGFLKNVAGMQYRVGENGEYLNVGAGEDKVEIKSLRGQDNFTIYVRTGEGAEPVKVEVGRMPNASAMIEKCVAPTSANGTDGKIVFFDTVKVKFGKTLDSMQLMETKEITGLEAGNYFICTAAQGNNLESTDEGITVDRFVGAPVEFEARTESKGILKNVAGMEYRVGETGDYTKVLNGESEVEVDFGTNISVTSFVVCVRPAGSTDEANVTKINVGRMLNPQKYIKETVPPTTIDGTDGKIIFNEEVKVKFGEEGSPLQEMTVTEIGGLGWGKIYSVKMAANGNMLGSIETLGVAFENFASQATVTFAAGDHGEGEMEPVKVAAGDAFDVPECKFTAVNADNVKYEFDGWEVTGDFEKTEDGKYIINGDTTFTALWKEIPVEPEKPVMKDITLTFDYNDGSGKSSSETKTVEEGTSAEFVLPIAPYRRDEHDFVGWEIDGAVYGVGATVYNSVDTTAKAVWKEREPLHYVLRFDANGGTGAPEPQDMGMSKLREVRLTVTDKVPTKDGMKFMGWSLHKGTEVVLEPGDVCLLNEAFPDLTVYAVWVDPASAPQTGDESNVALWAGIAAVSLVVIAGAVFFILKKNKKTDDDQIDTME